jgi:hypothetical protein
MWCFPAGRATPSACASGARKNWLSWAILLHDSSYYYPGTELQNMTLTKSPTPVFLMQLSEFDFPFDSSLIAAHPSLPRDHARLLVLQPLDRSLAHRRVDELPDLLQLGDLLVVNNTKVLAARVAGRKHPSGAEVEILFVISDAIWKC